MKKIKRCPLIKRIPRDFMKNFPKYFGMICILVSTICIGSAFQTVMDGAIRYLDDIKIENAQEDGFFETVYEINDESKDYFKDNRIQVVANFYATEPEYDGDCKILIFNERTEIDTPVLFDGKLPEADNEIALDHVFAKQKDINIGDTMRILDKDFKVCGTVSLPDYSSLFMNNTDLVMNTSHFCVSVVTKEGFDKFNEGDITYRYSYRYEDENLSKAKQISVSEDMLKNLVENGNAVQNFLRSDQNQSIAFLEMDIGTDGPFVVVFVYILVGMIAFIFAILTSNTIEKESVIIGTLLASGYRKGEIIWHYLQPTLIVAVIGSAIGNLLGYTAMIKPFMGAYYNTYSIGPIHIRFSIAAFITTTILPVVIMLLINYIMLASKMSLKPLKFLRRDLKKKKQKRASKLPNISFLNRFRLRIILQNKGSYIMLFLGIFLASFLLMFGIGIDPLMKHYTDTIDETLPYEYQYILKAPVESEKGEKLRAYEMDIWFPLGQKDVGISLMGIEKDSRFFENAVVDDGVTISSSFSKKMNLKVGDEFTLKDTAKEKEYTFKVTNIHPYNATLAVFMERSKLNELLGDDEELFNCIIADEKLDIDSAYIAKQICRDDLLGAANQMLDSFGTIIFFVNVFSVLVYIIIMYILTKVVIDKNAISISFMKVFGYERKEIRKVYLTATTIVVAASLIICLPIEALMFKAVLIFLSSLIEGYMEYYLPLYVYIEIVVIGLLAYFGINALHIRSIEKIPMTDALKNRE